MFENLKTRRLNLFELYRIAFLVFKHHFLYVAFIGLFVFGPMNVILSFFSEQFMFSFSDFQNLKGEDLQQLLVSSYSLIGVVVIFTPLANAAFTRVGYKAAIGEPVTVSDILDNSLIKLPRLIATSFFYMLCIMMTSILIVVPIFIAVTFVFFDNVIAMTDDWGIKAMAKCRKLIKGKWFYTLLIIIAVNISGTVAGVLLQSLLPISLFNIHPAINAALNTLVGIATAYFDLVAVVYFLNLYLMDQASEQKVKNETD